MSAAQFAISDAEFRLFRDLIFRIAGISMSDAKKVLLVGRLTKRLKHYGLGSFAEYHRLVTSGGEPEELQLMVDLLTTNETYFFREEKHFDFLRAVAGRFPAGRQLDVWSAASSTGEEAYTICMTLADVMGVDGAWTVTGSDISQSVLRVAEAGHYPLEKSRGLPPEYLRKYCLKGVRSQEGTFLIDRRLRAHTRFLQVNLNATLPEVGTFDVIFLRNVMIYFDPPTKREVVGRLVRKLKPKGHFIVGHSETLNGVSDDLRLLQPTIYQLP
ncbi:MAG TPA: CheR family methyltransferase [Rhodocyclaceae bacterium]|nr:CheR family methyltransferase [Rhodocyclaceae bacterium]